MSTDEEKSKQRNRGIVRLVVSVVILAALVAIARIIGLTDYVSLNNLGELREDIERLRMAAPLVFIAAYVGVSVALLPAAPLTFLAGLVFGPIWGAVYALIGATTGATMAFLIGRYAARNMVEAWVERNERLRKLDEGVERHGWRMLAITRLVPVFPFNLQNYVYGLTKIGLGAYVLVSGICMAPGVIAYAFAGGSLSAAGGDLRKTFLYLSVAAIFFVLVSLIPGWIKRRSRIENDR